MKTSIKITDDLRRPADTDLGWCDPVGIFVRLRTAIEILIEAKDNFRIRMDRATFALVHLRSEDFPQHLRERATRVLGMRLKVRREYGSDALFHFESLKPKERKVLIADIMSLYEACLIDLGRANRYDECVYPKSEISC